MRNFEYYTPTRIIFGKDTHYQIGELLKQGNYKKVLIHYGSGSIVRSRPFKRDYRQSGHSRRILCYSWRCGT